MILDRELLRRIDSVAVSDSVILAIVLFRCVAFQTHSRAPCDLAELPRGHYMNKEDDAQETEAGTFRQLRNMRLALQGPRLEKCRAFPIALPDADIKQLCCPIGWLQLAVDKE